MTKQQRLTSQELEAKYNELVRQCNEAISNQHDAESTMVEEVSAEGFASQKTRDAVNYWEEKFSDADFDLFVFKSENKEFVARLKAKRAEEKEAANDETFERFWNN